MANEICKHKKRAPKDTLKTLPVAQAGDARHKCAVCSYEAGYKAGFDEATELAKKKE